MSDSSPAISFLPKRMVLFCTGLSVFIVASLFLPKEGPVETNANNKSIPAPTSTPTATPTPTPGLPFIPPSDREKTDTHSEDTYFRINLPDSIPSEDRVQNPITPTPSIILNSKINSKPGQNPSSLSPYSLDESIFDTLAVSQGFGGDTAVNIRNFDPSEKPQTAILRSFQGLAGKFLLNVGGGSGRTTYLSSGDLNNDGVSEVVVSFGPITEEALYPNLVVARDSETGNVLGHSFEAFPSNSDSPINYDIGEIRTAVGDFIGSGTRQIAAAQGVGGQGIIRLFQYSGRPAPRGWDVVGQFSGLPSKIVNQPLTLFNKTTGGIGLTLAAADLDQDGKDELIVGQSNGPSSQTIFHVLDINSDGQIEARHPFAGFTQKYRGNGGIELAAADLNGDGWKEIIAASQGNSKNFGDARDTVPLNLLSVIAPIVQDKEIVGFERPGGKSVTNALSELMNPSGAMSITAGEFDGNRLNGDELIIGTGSFLDMQTEGIIPVHSSPESKYRFLKMEYDGNSITKISNWLGSNSGLTAFASKDRPTSGAIFLTAVERKTPVFIPAIDPPDTLSMGGFILADISYYYFNYNEETDTITNAAGSAWTSFKKEDTIAFADILYGVELIAHTFQVAQTVQNPSEEIKLQEAIRFTPDAAVGDTLVLFLPPNYDLSTPLDPDHLMSVLSLEEDSLYRLVQKENRFKVQFQNLTIKPFKSLMGVSINGSVKKGSAVYPALDHTPDRVRLNQAGFVTCLDYVHITPFSATAEAELEFPSSLLSGSDCRPGHVSLGTIDINSAGEYYKELNSASFGPWTVDNQGMVIQGSGVIADFSTTINWQDMEYFEDSWRGAILRDGSTVPGNPNTTLTNTGYMKAPYTFDDGIVTSAGLNANLALNGPFSFQTINPLGYTIYLNTGDLYMAAGQILSGSFTNGTITLPRKAVVGSASESVQAGYDTLYVLINKDLYAEQLTIPHDFVWGELSQSTPNRPAYKAMNHNTSIFYLSSSRYPSYSFLQEGIFNDPDFSTLDENTLVQWFIANQLCGVTVFGFDTLSILTPDTPNQTPVEFTIAPSSWLNVGGRGVNGRLKAINYTSPLELGPTHEETYVGENLNGNKEPFSIALTVDPIIQIPTHQTFDTANPFAVFQFIDSAIYQNVMEGGVILEGPINNIVPFGEMQFTSTAEIPGATIDLSNPVEMEYWGLMMQQLPNTSSAGVMSVKTGQIFLTAAGFSEERHFRRPFFLTWGVIQSSGLLGSLKFNYNSAGQRFDNFSFVTDTLGLSPYDPINSATKAYLEVAGTIHFDFFGSKYLNIYDYHDFEQPNAPYEGRRIELATDTYFGTKENETILTRNWGNSFGMLDFEIQYDSGDQDAFLGYGDATLNFIDSGLPASMVLDPTRICLSFYTGTGDERRDFALGPVARFSSMNRINGCACIENGQMKTNPPQRGTRKLGGREYRSAIGWIQHAGTRNHTLGVRILVPWRPIHNAGGSDGY